MNLRLHLASYVYAVSRFGRNVRLYLVTTALLGFTVFGGIYPVLFNLYLLRLDYGPELVGTVNSVAMFTFALCSLAAGSVGQRWGVHRAMIWGLAIALIGYSMLPLVEYMSPAWRTSWLIGTSFVRALGFALYWVNARPFLMGATRPEERAHAYSAAAAISPLAGFAGSLVAGELPRLFGSLLGVSLDDPAPYRYPLWIAAALLAPAVLAITAMREVEFERVQEQARSKNDFPLGLFAALSLAVFLGAAGAGTARSFFNVYLDDGLGISTSRIGTLAAFGQLLASATALSTPALAARWGTERAYLLGALGVAVGLLPLALIPHWAAAGLGFLGTMALSSITLPTINVYQMELVPARWRATMSGATSMANGLSWAITTFAGGYVILGLGYRTLFLAGAVLSAVGALFFWMRFCISRGGAVSLSDAG